MQWADEEFSLNICARIIKCLIKVLLYSTSRAEAVEDRLEETFLITFKGEGSTVDFLLELKDLFGDLEWISFWTIYCIVYVK